MPRFDPFPGVRYDLDRFHPADVTAPPYDVVSDGDRATLAARSPYNIVLVDVPAKTEGDDRYEAAGRRFRQWRDEGVLGTDDEPTFTVYRMAYTDDHGRPATTVGVIGALALTRPGEGDILPHEHTTPKARSDRLDLMRTTQANLSPIWGLSLSAGLTDLLTSAEPPQARWSDGSGVEHTVWIVRAPEQQAAISAAVAAQPVVIADGHHRYETALTFRDERRSATSSDASAGGTVDPAEATMCLVVELTDTQLTVRPIHRLVDGLPPELDLVDALAGRGFTPAGSVDAEDVAGGAVLERMAAAGAVTVVRPDGRGELLAVDVDAFGGVADLDSARIAHALEALPAHVVHHQHGADLVSKAVRNGEARWGVLLRPATVAQIAANAHAGVRMPAKTTFFHPKPKTGIVMRSLERPA